MIISCEKCTKKFNIQDDLIPDGGRLLQCGSCNHKWFYRLSNQKDNLEAEVNNDVTINESDKIKMKIVEENINTSSIPVKKKEIKKDEKKIINNKTEKNNNSTNLFKRSIVVIISIIALIILIDTFKIQLGIYIPDLNFILNNLYETIKDLLLFTKDLFN